MKVILTGAFFFSAVSLHVRGQETNFGFYAEVFRSQNIVTSSGGLYDVSAPEKIGFGLGANMFINEAHPVSFRPGFGAGYINEVLVLNDGMERTERGSIFIKMPVHLQFTAGKSSAFRVVTGITPSLGLAGGKDADNNLVFKRFDATADIGINYKIDGGTISVTPELKYSYSLANGIVADAQPYSDAIGKYLRNRFVLSLIISK